MAFQSFQPRSHTKNVYGVPPNSYTQSRGYATRPEFQNISTEILMTGRKMPQTAVLEAFVIGGFVGSKMQAGGSTRPREVSIFDFLDQKLAQRVPKNMDVISFTSNCTEAQPNLDMISFAASNCTEAPSNLDVISFAASSCTEAPHSRSFTLSESSTDSDDSFIVFDAESDDDDDDDATVIFEGDDSSSSDEDSGPEDVGDEDSGTEEISSCLLSCDCLSCDSRASKIEAANRLWNSYYSEPAIPKVTRDNTKKKVSFAAGKPSVRKMIVWDYAHRAARIGHWEEFVRDDDRFRKRIEQLSSIINPVISPSHRDKIFTDRFKT